MTKDNWIKALPKVVSSFLARLIKNGDIKPKSLTGWVALESPEIESFISQVEKDAIEKTNKRWVTAVVNQPPMFLKNNIVDIIESDRDRKVRRVRCVEILREMGFIKEADKLLEETRKLSDLLEDKK